MKTRKGFTLVEILIVVVILGILAAIVIPQFSDASTQSKLSSCRTTLQSLRSQIELYKIQHNDDAPPIPAAPGVWPEMTQYSDALGTTAPAKDVANGIIYGPYMQRVPVNPWNDLDSFAANDGAGVGWVYDEVEGDLWIAVTDLAVDKAEVAQELRDSGDAL